MEGIFLFYFRPCSFCCLSLIFVSTSHQGPPFRVLDIGFFSFIFSTFWIISSLFSLVNDREIDA